MRTGKGSTSSNLGMTNPRVALKVVYGRPPIEHRFKPGQSGNQRGRPKGKKSEATILYELLNRKITVREGGKPRKITVLEAILLRFTEDALKGNTKTAAFLFNRYASRDGDVNDDSSLTEDDRHVLSSFVRRLEAKLGAKT
jgi:hypothetical protein